MNLKLNLEILYDAIFFSEALKYHYIYADKIFVFVNIDY